MLKGLVGRMVKSKVTSTAGVAGFIGSAFAALCCIGFSALVGAVGAVGAGFLIRDEILVPLLGVSLLLSGLGLLGAYRRDREPIALALGLLGGAATFAFVLLVWSPGVYLGLAILLLATGWNLKKGVQRYRQEHKLEDRAA